MPSTSKKMSNQQKKKAQLMSMILTAAILAGPTKKSLSANKRKMSKKAVRKPCR